MRKKAMRLLLLMAILLSVLVSVVRASENRSAIEELRAEFRKNVGSKLPILTSKENPLSFLKEDGLEELYLKRISKSALEKLSSAKAMEQSQYFVYVDRNLDKQIIVVAFFDATCQSTSIIGVDKVSTGNQKRPGYFVTPVGIFGHSNDYRAEGTKNEKGWRGLGVKGSKVWDFGWRKTLKNHQKVEIRLLMHATDPDYGEPRLGKVASKGCVRISAKMNKFLDHFGILDTRGKYLLIGDSVNIR